MTRQLPVFALVLEKPERTGRLLTPHSDDLPCSSTAAPGIDGWSAPCDGIGMAFVSGRWRFAARNLTMGQIAGYLAANSMGILEHPVLDQTELKGHFDLRMEFSPEPNGSAPTSFQPDPTGPTFLQALKEQLGLKLESRIGPVDVLTIDHVEELSPN